MKKKILFIINPISGVGRQHVVEKLIGSDLDRSRFDYELAYTKAPKHAIELSRKGVQENFDIITAIGGDGSVNEVGQSLIGTASTLAILPCGSGNGAARHMNIPLHLKAALECLQKGRTQSIDTFTVNDHPVINVAGIGYAAHIAHEFSRYKKRGFTNYVKIAVRDSWRYRSQPCEIHFNGETRTINAFIIDIANGSQWGNNAVIAPKADNHDGWLELCLVKDFSFIHFPVMASRLFTKSIDRSPHVEIIRVKEVTIKQQYEYAHLDGEPYITGKDLNVKIKARSLNVIVP